RYSARFVRGSSAAALSEEHRNLPVPFAGSAGYRTAVFRVPGRAVPESACRGGRPGWSDCRYGRESLELPSALRLSARRPWLGQGTTALCLEPPTWPPARTTPPTRLVARFPRLARNGTCDLELGILRVGVNERVEFPHQFHFLECRLRLIRCDGLD